jgi:archaemetzincin
VNAKPSGSDSARTENAQGAAAHDAADPNARTEDLGAAKAPEPGVSETARVALVLSIQPLGADLPDPDVALVKEALLAFYDLDVQVASRVPLPQIAYYPKRGRYRAEKLLDFLEAAAPKNVFRTLGLTAVDISTTKGSYEDWGVLGLGTLDDGRACVISSFRTTRGASGPEHARIRLAKTAVHEIGHTLGLDHCPNVGCLMQDGHGTVFTTDGEYDLCAKCRAKLVAAGHPLAVGRAIPWPRPTPS